MNPGAGTIREGQDEDTYVMACHDSPTANQREHFLCTSTRWSLLEAGHAKVAPHGENTDMSTSRTGFVIRGRETLTLQAHRKIILQVLALQLCIQLNQALESQDSDLNN